MPQEVKASSKLLCKIDAIEKSKTENDKEYCFKAVETLATMELLMTLVRRAVQFNLDEFCQRELHPKKIEKLITWSQDERKTTKVISFHKNKINALESLEKKHSNGTLLNEVCSGIKAKIEKNDSHDQGYLGYFDLHHSFLKYLCFYQKQGDELVLIKSGDEEHLLSLMIKNKECFNAFIPSMGSAFVPDKNITLIQELKDGAILCSFNLLWQENPKYRTRVFSAIESGIKKEISRIFNKTLFGTTSKAKTQKTSFKQKEISTETKKVFAKDIPYAFYQRLSKHPRVKKEKSSKALYVELEKSGVFPYIETQSSSYQNIIAIDIDNGKNKKELLNRWKNQGVPAPSMIILNPEKPSSAQYLYVLKTPLLLTSTKAVNYLKDVVSTLKHHLEADKGYNGIYCKNPLFKGHVVDYPCNRKSISTDDIQDFLYELKDFSGLEKVSRYFQKDKGKNTRESISSSQGRNSTLFELGRFFGSQILPRLKQNENHISTIDEFNQILLGFLLQKNETLFKKRPLSFNEVKGIAKSISQWQWKNHEHTHKENSVFNEDGEFAISSRDNHIIKTIENKINQCIPVQDIAKLLKLSVRKVKEYGTLALRKIYNSFKELVINNFGMEGKVTVKHLREYLLGWFEQKENKIYKTHISIPSESTIKNWKKDGLQHVLGFETFLENVHKHRVVKKRQQEREYALLYRQEKALKSLSDDVQVMLMNESKVKSKKKKSLNNAIQALGEWLSGFVSMLLGDFKDKKDPLRNGQRHGDSTEFIDDYFGTDWIPV